MFGCLSGLSDSILFSMPSVIYGFSIPPMFVVSAGLHTPNSIFEAHAKCPYSSFDIVLYHKHEEIRGEVSTDITNAFISCSPSVYCPFLNMSF